MKPIVANRGRPIGYSLKFNKFQRTLSLHRYVSGYTILSAIFVKQDAQLSQRDRAAGCVIVFAKSRTLELGDNILRTL